MHSSNLHPKWWQLYLTFPLLIGLFVFESRLKLSVRGHQAVQIAILLLVYGLIHLWLKANAVALSEMDEQQEYGGITVIHVPVSPLLNEDSRPLFDLPVLEVKGVLDNTTDMDYIDAEAFPIDEVPQELK